MTNSASNEPSPKLPSIARKPLAWVPLPIKAKAITGAMNAMFVDAFGSRGT